MTAGPAGLTFVVTKSFWRISGWKPARILASVLTETPLCRLLEGAPRHSVANSRLSTATKNQRGHEGQRKLFEELIPRRALKKNRRKGCYYFKPRYRDLFGGSEITK